MDVGDVVPDFSLPDQYGEQRSLESALADGPVVIFFYPAAMTTGCTKESCHFRDVKGEFEALGAKRIGISMDSVDKQRAFSDANGFDYPLLSDVDGSVARLFGVKRSFGPLRVRRWTFVIGTDHRVIEIIKNEMRMDTHADQALAALRRSAVA